VKICLDANAMDLEDIKKTIEFIQPTYVSIVESENSKLSPPIEQGIILQLSDRNLKEIQQKIGTYRNSVEYVEITFHPEWLSEENDGIFNEIINDSRVMVSIPSLTDMDDLFRSGKIFRTINIRKPDFLEDDFRQTIEMFEDMD
ncbi:MAG: hypothetical protein K2Q22_02930, partial [Cytophagales bacterium]|nr:hypothetical protein [Cytophagales bacterium]